MIGREEICGALSYLIQSLQKCAGPSLEVEINGDVISVEGILQHAKELHKKLTQEIEKLDGGESVLLTRKAYIELIRKVDEADRVISTAPAVDQGEEMPY